MLELRPTCENCNKNLPADSTEAMICSYECTFCQDCVHDIMENVCPNCGGGFQPRPIRPQKELLANPPSDSIVHKPINLQQFSSLKLKNKDVLPQNR